MLRALRREPPVGGTDEAGWSEALDFAERARVTLVLRAALLEGGWWDGVPVPIRRRLDQNLADNTVRLERLRAAAAEIAERFADAGVEFVALKGLSHSPDFIADPRLRVQYDLDYYCPREMVGRARDALLAMGYEPTGGWEAYPVDHLPTMLRKTGWQWRGNYFDPELPPAVDLHFRFWDEQTERLAAPGVEEFWKRREGRELELADRLGYAALHAVRDLLRGDLRLYQIYEIARFLENRNSDAAFWGRWRERHAPELRRLESIAFGLAERWFGCRMPEAAELGPEAAGWLGRYAWSPIEALFRPNKYELYLHVSLLRSGRDKWAVAARRLLPLRLPGPVEAVHVPEARMTAALRLRRRAKYATFVISRLLHHARVLAPTLWGWPRWRRTCNGMFTSHRRSPGLE